MRQVTSFIFCLLIISCSKKDKTNDPFIGYMQIDSTTTIKTVAVGQDISSRVKLAIPSISGEVTFLGFEIIESPIKIFSIKAKAFYKPWTQQVSLPVYQTFDTTLLIKTNLTGQHILKFYNGINLLKADTIQVN